MEALEGIGLFVAGVVVTLALEHGATWVWRRAILPRWQQYALKRRTSGLIQDGELLMSQTEPVYVAQFEPAGFDPEHIHCRRAGANPSLQASARAFGIDIPDDDGVAALIQDEVERLAADPAAWNGESLSLRGFSIGRFGAKEDAELELVFAPSDHATSRALKPYWMQERPSVERLTGDRLRHVCAAFSHGFGLNVTVETADRQLVLTRRGLATSQQSGRMHISVNEGMRSDDLTPAGDPDPIHTVLRGCAEELGIVVDRAAVTLHSLILDVHRYEWAMLGHVDLRGTELSASAIASKRAVGRAPDDWETDHLEFVPFRPEEVVARLLGGDEWVPHGLVNLALSGVHRFQSRGDEIVRALAQRGAGEARKRRPLV